MNRVIEPEWLDELPPHDPRAEASRRDLRRLNRIMGHFGIVRSLLATGLAGRTPKRIVELGAGDGWLLLQLAGHFAPGWPGVEVVTVDAKPAISDQTRRQIEALGWRLETVEADVFDWLRKAGEPADAMFANLFLHHFPEGALAELFRLAAARTRLFAAAEPRRALTPLTLSRFAGLIGCNDVTRHDIVTSVRAGFAGRELSADWPAAQQWRLTEKRSGLCTHLFLAEKTME